MDDVNICLNCQLATCDEQSPDCLYQITRNARNTNPKSYRERQRESYYRNRDKRLAAAKKWQTENQERYKELRHQNYLERTEGKVKKRLGQPAQTG